MTARLHYSLAAVIGTVVSTEAAGYSGTNSLTPQVGLPWRTTVTGSAAIITFDLGSSKNIAAFSVNHTNAVSWQVLADNVSTPSTSRGTIAPAVDYQGRYKGSLIPAATTARYVRFTTPAATPIDGAAFFEAGFFGIWLLSTTLPREPLYGASVKHTRAQVKQVLSNGRVITGANGVSYANIELPFTARATEDIENAKRLAQAGTCWLDLGIAANAYLQWPVCYPDEASERRIVGPNRETTTLPFKEDC